MTDLEPSETENLDRYGNRPLVWSDVRDLVVADPSAPLTWFLCTARADGTPHAAGVGAQWLDGDLYFTSSAAARKARDLADNPRCTIAVSLPGIDVVFDGVAAHVTDAGTLQRVSDGYNAGGWPCEVSGDALTAPFSAPSAGPPPWQVYRFTFHQAVGVGGPEPGTGTMAA